MIAVCTDTPDALFDKTAAAAFEKLGLKGKASVELILVSRDEIRKVNARERGIDSVTDVLSFPLLSEIKPFDAEHYPFDFDFESGSVCLGSILICDEVAAAQASEYGHSVERERAYLFLHGLLHLLGYDHIEESDRLKMREAEERVLEYIGITR